jgi:formamidopyrimidine-DNA glycosylase
MPEINEIKRYADFLREKLQNKKIEEINILGGRYKTHNAFPLYDELKKQLPIKVIDVKSKGKFMYITLENGFYIFCTLGLAGGWIFKKNNKYEHAKQNYGLQFIETATDHLNVEFKIKNGSMY